MRNAFFIISALTLLCFQGYGLGIEAGYYSDPTLTSGAFSLTTDYSSNNFTFGATFNSNLSLKDYGLESAVVRVLEYDDGTTGIRYAPIEGMTFGYGLLLNDLHTSFFQPAFLTNTQCGLRIGLDEDDYSMDSFGTYSHLYGIQLKDISFLNMNIGLEYVSDASREGASEFGRSAIGAFTELPLNDVFSLYAESAGSSNGGEGNMAGLAFNYDMIVAFARFHVAAVSFNDRFIPGYFSSGYDIDPVDFSSLEADGKRRYGSMSSADIGILGLIDLNLYNENYTDGGAANSGTILITPIDRFVITGFCKQLTFTDYRAIAGKDFDLAGGSFEYRTKMGIYYSLTYKKTSAAGSSFDSSYFKVGYNF